MVIFAEKRPKLSENLTQHVSEWACNLRFEDLPPQVVANVKRGCLDFVVLALAGSSGKGVGAIRRGGVDPVIAFARANAGECTVIGTDVTTLPQYAALANGTFGHALNLMDIHRGSVPTHIGPTIFPAAFAVSQVIKTDFPTFATAIVVGFEIIAKLAMGLQPGLGSVETVPANSLGAAVQTAKLLGLDKQGFTDCLGIATSFTSGAPVGLELTNPGYWCRPALTGWHAHNGIVAALLAREGLHGSARILEAPYGFLNSFSVIPDASGIERLGNPYEITRDGLKRYPSTRYIHAELDGLLALVRDNNVQNQDVKRVTIEKPLAMHEVTGSEERKTPSAPEVARLSSYYFAAVVLLRHSAWLDALEPEVFNAPETWETMQKIHCIHNPDFDPDFPAKYTSRVSIELANGHTLSTTVEYPKGDPEDPFSDDELVAKCNSLYDYCLTDLISKNMFDEIVSRILSLEQEEDIGAFCSLLAAGQESP